MAYCTLKRAKSSLRLLMEELLWGLNIVALLLEVSIVLILMVLLPKFLNFSGSSSSTVFAFSSSSSPIVWEKPLPVFLVERWVEWNLDTRLETVPRKTERSAPWAEARVVVWLAPRLRLGELLMRDSLKTAAFVFKGINLILWIYTIFPDPGVKMVDGWFWIMLSPLIRSPPDICLSKPSPPVLLNYVVWVIPMTLLLFPPFIWPDEMPGCYGKICYC